MLDTLLQVDPLRLTLGVTSVILTLTYFLVPKRPARFPPGPGLAIPVLGHLHLLGRKPREQLQVRFCYSTLYPIWGEYQLQSVCLCVCVCLSFYFFTRPYILHGQSISFSLCVCVYVRVSTFFCPIIDLHCCCTDQAQTWWRDKVYPYLDPSKKNCYDNFHDKKRNKEISMKIRYKCK